MPINAVSTRGMIFDIRLENLFAIVSLTSVIRMSVQSLVLYVCFHESKRFSHLVNFFVVLRVKLFYGFSCFTR